jgi:2-methylcitrate dehydratase PrpD
MTDAPTTAVTVPLAEWVADLRFDAIPPEVRQRAKYLLLDGVACGLVGAQLNSTYIQGFELDDFHPLAPLHSNSLILPVLLAGARQLGPVTGKLYGLDAAQLEDALGMAGTQSGGLMAAQYEAMSKRMQHGFAARNGFYAAGLALGGYTGIKQVFDRPYGGFLAVFGDAVLPPRFAADRLDADDAWALLSIVDVQLDEAIENGLVTQTEMAERAPCASTSRRALPRSSWRIRRSRRSAATCPTRN